MSVLVTEILNLIYISSGSECQIFAENNSALWDSHIFIPK